MPVTSQDPIFSFVSLGNITGGAALLQNIASRLNQVSPHLGVIGWALDEYDPGATHGPELYIHTRSNFGAEAYFSLKAFNATGTLPEAIQIWQNTGYSNQRRVDNQPGMFAKTRVGPTNTVSETAVFSNTWDQSGANRNAADPGDYKTADGGSGSAGSAPTFTTTLPMLWTTGDSATVAMDAWLLWDPNQGASPALGGSRVIAAHWYLGNAMYGFVIGKPFYDSESAKTHGSMLVAWGSAYADKDASTILPVNNSLGGEIASTGAQRAMNAIIRSFTKGSTTWPTPTPNGAAIAYCGPCVLNEGKIEGGDDTTGGDRSAHHRPDQRFSDTWNTLQPSMFPDPAVTIYYDRANDRRGVCRHRNVSRFPDGGEIDPIAPPLDWRDSGFFFPWYYAPVVGLAPGNTFSNGTRRYIAFPGGRGGDSGNDGHRYAGIAWRISDGA